MGCWPTPLSFLNLFTVTIVLLWISYSINDIVVSISYESPKVSGTCLVLSLLAVGPGRPDRVVVDFCVSLHVVIDSMSDEQFLDQGPIQTH